jgi:hypothetical protein
MLVLIIDQDVNNRMVVSVELRCCRVKVQIDVAGTSSKVLSFARAVKASYCAM